MKHLSIPIKNSAEIIESTQISPLVTKCCAKVLYISDQPNRNDSVFTREVAEEMGKNLPGSPVVGLYNKETQDFEEHSRGLEYNEETDKFELIDLTKAYGFVGDKIWFQDFLDDNEVTRTYLCAEIYIWTEAYPESKSLLDNNSNQSMELSEKNSSGYWTNENNSGERIFIFNSALIEKLCILGEQFEPCFEGAQIRTNFSLEDAQKELEKNLYSMIFKFMAEGGNNTMNLSTIDVVDEPAVVTITEDFKCGGGGASGGSSSDEKKKDKKEKSSLNKKEDKVEEETSDSAEDSTDEKDAQEDEKKEKKRYNLDEITEYVELSKKYIELEANFNELKAQNETFAAEVKTLKEFKETQELAAKKEMIDSFYMLSDVEKADVVKNIKNYSLDEIEAKLSVICVRNKLNLSEDKAADDEIINTYNLNAMASDDDGRPGWAKAVHDYEVENENI